MTAYKVTSTEICDQAYDPEAPAGMSVLPSSETMALAKTQSSR